ncbi:capsular biosynthesis protein [Thiocystis violacea]|uniref:capsular polysaccharide export protein, LipB/KpsS family n=1 Tax=Thiocystis violacea TaxID=13725 RepID=UPI001905F7BB|nr:capsular biosynthesis protein [Thiocystis violacea]MBK1718930.1 capsular biosynthesis protein [Thiocystis violacea]
MPAKPILFIDPGPNLVQYLAAVGERLAPHYRAVFFSRRVKSRGLLRRLGQEIHPDRDARRAHAPSPSIRIDPEALLARLRKESDKALTREQGPAFRRLVGELDACLDRLQPAGVFCWNGSGLAAAIAEQLARARGLPLLFAENGYLPNTLQLDPEGVNAFSSIGRDLDLDAIRARPYSDQQRRELDARLDDYRAGKSPPRAPPAQGRVRPPPLAYLIQAWNDWREREPSRPLNRRIPRQPPELPERFVFFPLQVRSDSQLTLHSPLYGNRLDLAIADLDQSLRAIDPELKLAIKLHPADLGKTDYDPMVERFPQHLWIGGGDVRTLLQRAECVVTINSTVGIEAMIFGKPVVALGDNFYVREGLVHPVRDRAELTPRLRQALSQAPDAGLIEPFLRFLYFDAFVRAHWRDYSEASLNHLAERMMAMVQVRSAD